jgi:N-methylhydantoinase A/oxoprolinase/acetone carboxylase beta subunit
MSREVPIRRPPADGHRRSRREVWRCFSTIGTNVIVERRGTRVNLLSTAGHGDALTMMRGNGRTAGAPPDLERVRASYAR